MREIKFRAWDKKNKVMLLGSGRPTDSFLICSGGKGISTQGDGEFELMQYTGLKDKNGKEIYEGDVVKTKDGTFKVYWNKYVWAFNSPDQYIPFSSYDWESFEEMNLEVIGNIYENSELISSNQS